MGIVVIEVILKIFGDISVTSMMRLFYIGHEEQRVGGGGWRGELQEVQCKQRLGSSVLVSMANCGIETKSSN